MTHTKMKLNTLAVLNALMLIAILFVASPVLAQNSKKLDVFSDAMPEGSQWSNDHKYVRKGGQRESKFYIYVHPSKSPAEMTGLSIPIRKNPGPGEYRYVTFRWIKWGGEQIGIRFLPDSLAGKGAKYNFTYTAGKSDSIKNALSISDNAPGNWTAVTRDLWKDFGEFTLTGLSFICPDSRDAGFDAISLGKTTDVFEDAPEVLPTKVAEALNVQDYEDVSFNEDPSPSTNSENSQAVSASLTDTSSVAGVSGGTQGVQVDWMAQIKAGGVWMYPLYAVGLVAILVALQRMISSRAGNLAPRRLRRKVRESLAAGDVDAAIAACEKYPSTLASSLYYILKYRHAGMDVVSTTAGDIAARDVREHLARIYPLSVMASLGPLLGLLGTIVGMIEAFGLVALYGDAGGPAILSDSISKALITTAAGLIIAIPAIAVYFVIKKRIMSLASVIEVEVEHATTMLYLAEDSLVKTSVKSEDYAPTV